MPIVYKTSIKTSLTLFLFTVGLLYLSAGNPDSTLLISKDTITSGTTIVKKEAIQESPFIIPNGFVNKKINFQVNSAINYLSFGHFVKNESKKMFFHAWLKEKELALLSAQTDSLRKVYAISSNDKKVEVSGLIMKNEERSIALNSEISILYQNARDQEDQYWQSATTDEITRFQKKIRLFSDSIDRINETVKSTPQTIPDTIILYKSPPKIKEVKSAPLTEIIYKIQIGVFKGKTPDLAKKLIKKLSIIRKIENYKDEKGVTVYTTGNLKTWQEAITMQNQVKQEGVKNAPILAFKNGKKITVDEARKITNEP